MEVSAFGQGVTVKEGSLNDKTASNDGYSGEVIQEMEKLMYGHLTAKES